MSQQSPTIPTPINAIEVDAAISHMQTVLNTRLPWLTHPYRRAYQLLDSSIPKQKRYLPYVYIGEDRNTPKYFVALPDNDKQGQCLFFVQQENSTKTSMGYYGWLSYKVAIVFSVNLQLINASLLATDVFTQNLVADVRNVLIRENLGTSYRATYDKTLFDAREVWSGFDVELSTVEKVPLQHFRMDFTLELKENCNGLPYDRCSTLISKLTTDDKNNCLLPSYDFTDAAVQAALTPQQIQDLTNWLL